MREETAYLKDYSKKLNLIVEKIEGNGEDLTFDEREILRKVHSDFLEKEKLEVE